MRIQQKKKNVFDVRNRAQTRGARSDEVFGFGSGSRLFVFLFGLSFVVDMLPLLLLVVTQVDVDLVCRAILCCGGGGGQASGRSRAI